MKRPGAFSVTLAVLIAIAFSFGLSPAQEQEKEQITIATKKGIGRYLMQSNGQALYTYKNDPAGASTCRDACIEKFPVYCYNPDMIKVGEGLRLSDFSHFVRSGTDTQEHLTYKGMPLYEYIGDKKPGDTNGQGIDGLWSVAKP
jgi:predicted lipoprotein with Yx(FWY)xxD motif